MKIIDLRSDTVTRPSPEMRAVMASAEVGDDIFHDDPTVNRLQERFAALAGKEDALYVSSGTQGNQIAIKCHTTPGDEILCDANSHILHYETGAPAALSGVALHGLSGNRGMFTREMIEEGVRPIDDHQPRTSLVVIENTHNRGGGSIWPIDQIREVTAAARARHLKNHLDGARIFNAVVATGIPLSEWASHFDTISVCFSKGLGAPVGSIIAGSKDFIRQARRYRKMFGGAMRQVGIIAAAAEYALDHNVNRLAEDHANAKLLATGLSNCPAFEMEPTPETNMVFWKLKGTKEQAIALVQRCRAGGVWFNHVGNARFRAVTHLDVTSTDMETASATIHEEAARI